VHPAWHFRQRGSEVVSLTAGTQDPFTKRIPLWGPFRNACLHQSLFLFENLAQFGRKVNPSGKPPAEKLEFGFHIQLVEKEKISYTIKEFM